MTQIPKIPRFCSPIPAFNPPTPLIAIILLTSLLTRDRMNPRFHHPHHRESPTDDGHHRREIIVPGPVLFAVRHGDGG